MYGNVPTAVVNEHAETPAILNTESKCKVERFGFLH